MGLTTYSFNQMLLFSENYLAIISLHVREVTLQCGIRPPRCRCCVPAAIHFTDESSDGSNRGLDGLDCATELVDRGSSLHRGSFPSAADDGFARSSSRRSQSCVPFSYSFVVSNAMASCCIVFRRQYLNHITVVVCTLQFCSICRRQVQFGYFLCFLNEEQF